MLIGLQQQGASQIGQRKRDITNQLEGKEMKPVLKMELRTKFISQLSGNQSKSFRK